jgi:HD-like signal output (HDOD) protein
VPRCVAKLTTLVRRKRQLGPFASDNKGGSLFVSRVKADMVSFSTNSQRTRSEGVTKRLGLRIEQAKWQYPLPDGARRIIASGDFDGRENETLVRWLASDPDLSKRLLLWCNTPLFNLSTPFRTLEEASKVMDGRDMARLAVLAWARNLFLPDVRLDIYSRDFLWSHCVAVGSVASMISRTCGRGDPSLAFVAGALHDVGMCVSESLDQEAFIRVLSETDDLSPLHEVEEDLLGWSHCELGQGVLELWGMPEAVSLAARYHHAPELATEHIKHLPIIASVAVANYFCSRSGWASTGSQHIAPPGREALAALGIDADLLGVLYAQVPTSIQAVANLR